MSTSTPNFNLTKPAGSENVDIATINSNMDKIDAGVEPVHATQTATGSNGVVTIADPLDAPVLNLTATGMGAPPVFYVPGMSAQAQGQQTWNVPLVLDVPIGIINGSGTQIVLNYGGGVGSNEFIPTAGKETGSTVYYNSRDLAALFKAADAAHATVTQETNSVLFACPLPFSVAENSIVYCSHLKNQNVSGEEGIWASGSTLYLRISADRHINHFIDLAAVMSSYVSVVNYYTPNQIKGIDPQNWIDFFVCVTPESAYTRAHEISIVRLPSGTMALLYFKITDYIATVSGQGTPSPTPLTSVSVQYYTDTDVNRAHRDAVDSIIAARFEGPAALGSRAVAENGGAVGVGASSVNGQGGAVGMDAVAHDGGAVGFGATESNGGAAVGFQASSTSAGAAVGAYAEEISGGGAVGYQTKAASGGAVGYRASETSGGGAVGSSAKVASGGAVGAGAMTTDGCAIGLSAECYNSHGDPIDAIQLGTGTNQSARSMQVYSTKLLIPIGTGVYETHVIPLSLITASYHAASTDDQNAFKQELGIS